MNQTHDCEIIFPSNPSVKGDREDLLIAERDVFLGERNMDFVGCIVKYEGIRDRWTYLVRVKTYEQQP